MYELNAYLEDLIDEIRFTWRELRSELYSAGTLEEVGHALVGTPLLDIFLTLLKGKPLLKFESMEYIIGALENEVDSKIWNMSSGCY